VTVTNKWLQEMVDGDADKRALWANDEWKDTDAVETLTYLLDAVMTDFINKLESLRDSEDAEKRKAFMSEYSDGIHSSNRE